MSVSVNMYISAKMFKHLAEYSFDQTCVEKPEEERKLILQEYQKLLFSIEGDDPQEQKKLDALWNSQWEDQPQYLIPFIVNASFACELYLKAILTHDNVPYSTKGTDGHDLKKLFATLPDVRKTFIIERMPFDFSSDFNEMLEEIRFAFKEWRYWFEGNASHASCLFVGAFCDVLHSYAFTVIQEGS